MMNFFCGMVDWRKAFSFISSRDHLKLCSSDNYYTSAPQGLLLNLLLSVHSHTVKITAGHNFTFCPWWFVHNFTFYPCPWCSAFYIFTFFYFPFSSEDGFHFNTISDYIEAYRSIPLIFQVISVALGFRMLGIFSFGAIFCEKQNLGIKISEIPNFHNLQMVLIHYSLLNNFNTQFKKNSKNVRNFDDIVSASR